MTRATRAGTFLLAIMALCAIGPGITLVQAQPDGAEDDSATRKRVEIVRTTLKPDIDGMLDDEIWRHATVIRDMHQFQPVDRASPSEDSVFYITYDEDYFYLAARLYDSEPGEIISRQLVQGGGMGSDDSFEFILDTFNNSRTGYHFQVNPNGIRRESVFEDPTTRNNDWSGIWIVESNIDEQGWTAEVAIPFRTLNFNPETTEWGFSVARTIARKREEIAWSSYNRNVNPTTTGLIYGIHDIRQGLGLDVIPSVSVGRTEDFAAGESNSLFEPSVNAFYKITPNLTGALTINTDFSATEVDNRQVNLSRFSLFFPEKREFFLQDVDIFSFGGLSQNGIPFYSRRIGLGFGGEPIDIEAGVKLTGRVGDWNVGTLAVQQGDVSYLDGQSVFVGRVARNVLAESSIGAIMTYGDPSSELDNSVIGADFRYQNTYFSETHSVRGNAWFQQSDTEGVDGDQKAFGLQANLDTSDNGFGLFSNYTQIGDDFYPALGFVNNRGIRSFDIGGNGRYQFRDHPLLRSMFSFMRFGRTEKLDTGELQSQDFFWRVVNLNTHRGDRAGFGGFMNKEGLDRDFQIRPGIIIPAGVYSFSGFNAEVRLAGQRELSPSLNFSKGGFYNGDRTQYNFGMDWRPNAHLEVGFNYNYQDITLPAGDFVTRLIRMNANYAFNSKWSWINLLQYDNGSDAVGINSRLRWNPQAGENLYLVVNYNFDGNGAFRELNADASEIVLKYTKTFRF